MLTKIALKRQLVSLPEQFSIDQLVEKLILIEKIDSGNRQSKNDDIISESNLNKEIEKWFK